MPTPDQTGSPFAAARSLQFADGYGGKIASCTELPLHALGDDFVVEGSGTVKRFPAVPAGLLVTLRIQSAPTFVNSANLICPNGVDYQAKAGDLVTARSDGDGVWRLFVKPASGSQLLDQDLSASATQKKQARSNTGVDIATLSKSANYTVVAADYGALIKLTSSATLALTAAATLGDGWKCDIRNTSTGMWTIDPNGSETINGSTTFNVYPGENFRLVCDGTGFFTVGTGTGLILMDTKVGSPSATLDFLRTDTNRFYKYDFVFEGVFPSTAASDVWARVSTDGGSTFLTTGYARTILYSVSGTTVGTDAAGSLAQFPLVVGPGNDIGYAISGRLSATVTGGWTYFEASHTSIDNTGTTRRLMNEGGSASGAANAFRFLCASGNINGTIRQYGYSK